MQTTTIKFSIVIPLFNKAGHILDTLATVARQQWSADEILIIDDGSTDGGAAVVEAANIPRVRVIRKANGGVSSARNLGIESARNEYIALLDADDLWDVHFLAEIARLIHTFPDAGMFSTSYQIINERGEYCTARIDPDHLPQKECIYPDFIGAMAEGDLPINMSTIVIRKSLFNKIGGFPIGEPMGEDQDFLFRAALAAPIAFSPRMLSIYKQDSANRACNRHLPTTECPFSKRLSAYGQQYNADQDTQRKLAKCSAAHIIHLAGRHIRQNNLRVAKQLLSDTRCMLKPLHKVYWEIQLMTRNFLAALRLLNVNNMQ